MQYWKRAQVLFGALLFLFILGLFFVQKMIIWHHILVLCTAAAGLAWFTAGRKLHKAEKDKLAEDMQWKMILTLNQHRHDWMNDLQILSGYTQLKKQDEVLAHIGKIREKMYTETSISRLGIASVISYLVSFSSKKSAIQLDVVMEQNTNLANVNVCPKVFQLAIVEVLEHLAAANLVSHQEQHLRLQLEGTDQETIIEFEYTGEYDAAELHDRLQRTLSAMERLETVKMNCDLREKEADVEIRIRSNH